MTFHHLSQNKITMRQFMWQPDMVGLANLVPLHAYPSVCLTLCPCSYGRLGGLFVAGVLNTKSITGMVAWLLGLAHRVYRVATHNFLMSLPCTRSAQLLESLGFAMTISLLSAWVDFTKFALLPGMAWDMWDINPNPNPPACVAVTLPS